MVHAKVVVVKKISKLVYVRRYLLLYLILIRLFSQERHGDQLKNLRNIKKNCLCSAILEPLL